MPPLGLRPPRPSLPSHFCPSVQWLSLLPLQLSRSAHHASQGRANGSKQGPGKRLGAKKGATQLVVPGNIIFRQRGTKWFPGENCGMGRDRTIFAKEKGYVCFYKDPELHPERKYIGVVFRRGMTLPTPRNKPRIRRLGLVGKEREMGTLATATPPRVASGEGDEGLEVGGMTEQDGTLRQQDKKTRKKVPDLKKLELRPGYSYRESNWHIGRAAERAQVKVREYKKRDWSVKERKIKVKKANEKKKLEKLASKSRKKKGSKK